METKEQVKEAFLRDLKALLSRYGAELETEDHWQGHPECGEDVRMTVTIPSKFSSVGGIEREWTEIDLGRRFRAQ